MPKHNPGVPPHPHHCNVDQEINFTKASLAALPTRAQVSVAYTWTRKLRAFS
jgi:hypothetical protein